MESLHEATFTSRGRVPTQGVLDELANRCYAQGTNAWTETDHTCFTITTVSFDIAWFLFIRVRSHLQAGAEGFLELLPVYMDHILFPLLNRAGFTTEIHHIDGDGNDGGVVYSEMQSIENTADGILSRKSGLAPVKRVETRDGQIGSAWAVVVVTPFDWIACIPLCLSRLPLSSPAGASFPWGCECRIREDLYPEPCNYRRETGGMLAGLRDLRLPEVRQFHNSFYRSDRLALIITGRIKAEVSTKSSPLLAPFSPSSHLYWGCPVRCSQPDSFSLQA